MNRRNILIIVAVAFLIVTIGYVLRPHLGLHRRSSEENQQLEDEIMAGQASGSNMEAELGQPKEGLQPRNETLVSDPLSQAGFGLEDRSDIQKPRESSAVAEPSRVIKEPGVESKTVQPEPQGLRPSGKEELESEGVGETRGELLSRSKKQMQAVAVSENASAGTSHAVIRRSAIALGVQNREPVDISQRVSVSQQHVYCWMHVINDKGGKVTVRWIRKGHKTTETHLPVGSNSWRTWAYASLTPSMMGPARVEILDENGAILKTLSFEITE